MEDFKSRGGELIKELKDHISRVVESEEGKTNWSLGQIEEASGLMIIGKTGQNVWDMAVGTLVIELVKDGVLQSDIPVERLNTKSAAIALFWPKIALIERIIFSCSYRMPLRRNQLRKEVLFVMAIIHPSLFVSKT